MSHKTHPLLLSIVLISLSSASFAFDPPNKNRGNRMIQELSLSTEQQEQFMAIMTEQRSAAKAWRKTHQEQTREKLSHVLDDTQMKKLDGIKKHRSQKRPMCKKNKNF